MESSIDLSKATKLREVAFYLDGLYIPWVIVTLKTITPKHRDLQEVTISSSILSRLVGRSIDVKTAVGPISHGQWVDLDIVLVQLWEWHSVRVKIAYYSGGEGEQVPKLIEEMLPETTRRGIVRTANFSELR